MNLSEYIKSERGNATKVAAALRVSLSYLSQMATPGASISPARCVLIESASDCNVMRWDTRPDDWQEIWPELAKQPSKQRTSAQATAASAVQGVA